MNVPLLGLGAFRPRFRDSAAPPGIDLFLLIAYCERTISGLGASRPRFRDSAAPPGIDVFLLTAYCERTISGPGCLQGPDSGIPTAPPGIDLFLFIAYCERTISGPGRFQAQIPGFGYSFNWPFLSFHDLRRILSIGLSFPSTICVVFFQLGSQFLPQFASYSF